MTSDIGLVSIFQQLQTVCRGLHQETERLTADLEAAGSRLQQAESRALDVHLTCKCSSGRATAVNHAATAHLCRCAILKLWCASVLQISQAMQPASVTSSRTPFQRVGVHRQQELTKAAEGAEALSSEVERLEAELHTATAAADSMVNSVFQLPAHRSARHMLADHFVGRVTCLHDNIDNNLNG